ncbi:MAG: hypothetical protein H6Q11_1633, partial [Acidobacteria bacterium]|nr:hypothetical protein [Acidobacteriota bacterium]
MYLSAMTTAAPGALHGNARPPVSVVAAPAPGAAEVTALRLTAIPRPYIRPRLAPGDGGLGHAPDDPVVRRYWSALVGPGAVADLLRLTAAARRGRRVRRPLHLSSLLREGLVHRDGEAILVPERVPRLDDGQQRRLHPSLRAEYRRHL